MTNDPRRTTDHWPGLHARAWPVISPSFLVVRHPLSVAYQQVKLPLPGDAVILPMMTRAAPHAPMLSIEVDRVDGPRRTLGELQRVTHLPERLASRLRERGRRGHAAG